jgi:hypothetical protein
VHCNANFERGRPAIRDRMRCVPWLCVHRRSQTQSWSSRRINAGKGGRVKLQRSEIKPRGSRDFPSELGTYRAVAFSRLTPPAISSHPYPSGIEHDAQLQKHCCSRCWVARACFCHATPCSHSGAFPVDGCQASAPSFLLWSVEVTCCPNTMRRLMTPSFSSLPAVKATGPVGW